MLEKERRSTSSSLAAGLPRAKGEFDTPTGVARMHLTSSSSVRAASAKAAVKTAEAEAKADAPGIRATKKAAKQEAVENGKKERAAKKEQRDAEKAVIKETAAA